MDGFSPFTYDLLFSILKPLDAIETLQDSQKLERQRKESQRRYIKR